MEALGLATSIVAVVQISTRVVALCTKCIESVDETSNALRLILIEVSALKGLFEPLKVLVCFDKDTTVLETQLSAPVKGCLSTVGELCQLIDSIESGDGGLGKRQNTANLKSRFAWLLKQDRARRLLDLLGVYKSTINLLLSNHGM